ncbi:MAG: pantoate--beta-alanine ligase [Actinomycetota bacterium]
MTTLFTDLQSFKEWRDAIPKHEVVGFIPTMGALHEGHTSLMQRARVECDHVVVSIYVNALQFNSSNDFTKYPRTESEDFELCAQIAVDAVLVPLQSEIFPMDSIELLTPSKEAENFEGADRPGHFAGVVTVVDRLFTIVRPSIAYFGLKDYQQLAVISKMASQMHPNIDIRPCETMREPDGLAMSSRNRFLSESARVSAGLIPLALTKAIARWKNGTTQSSSLLDEAQAVLARDSTIKVQYVSIVRRGTMSEVSTVAETDVIIAAVVVDGIRLIDNMQFSNA